MAWCLIDQAQGQLYLFTSNITHPIRFSSVCNLSPALHIAKVHISNISHSLMWFWIHFHKSRSEGAKQATNSMKQEHTWEKRIPLLLKKSPSWDPKLYCPILNQMNPLHILSSYFRSILILSSSKKSTTINIRINLMWSSCDDFITYWRACFCFALCLPDWILFCILLIN
jgi:hypothetical protein